MKLIPLYKNDRWLKKLAEWRDRSREVLLTQYAYGEDLDRQRAWADRAINSEADYFFYITDGKCFEELIGYCGLIKIKMVARTAELSILINPDKMRQGFGKKAIRELLRIGFMELGLNCIYVDCYTNTTRNRFFEKQGFMWEGQLRARKYWSGKWYDSIILSITREEYDKFI